MSTVHAARRHMVETDHFHPEEALDPAEQRRRRGWLEQIDYTAYASSREVAGRVVGRATPAAFQALALHCAQARAAWVAEGLRGGGAPEAARLAELRGAYEELVDVYEAARRMVERGYLAYEDAPSAP